MTVLLNLYKSFNLVFVIFGINLCSIMKLVLIIFLQGSCQVLKKLREVKSCLTQHNDRVVGFENGIL